MDMGNGAERNGENERIGSDDNSPDVNIPQDASSQDNTSRNLSRSPRQSHSRRQSERTVRTTVTYTENIQGLDDLSSCINSVDDHLQAGLQELRHCVANLRTERTEMNEKVRTLSEEMHRVLGERDSCQGAVVELQQELSSVREQLYIQQQEKEELMVKMQNMQQRNQDHLVNIAGKQRSRRLAHNALVRWRRKALDKGLKCTEQLHLLEEENSQLRAELLLCQEAAKQAFLRSANVLNSEAITMFQDAATRRLGFEETPSQGSQSPPGSPGTQPRSSQEKSNIGVGSAVDDKENFGGYREGRAARIIHSTKRHTDGREGAAHEGTSGSDDDRSYIATYGSDDQGLHMHTCHGSHSMTDLHQRRGGNFGEREGGYGMHGSMSDRWQPSVSRPVGDPSEYNPASEDMGAVGGNVPLQSRRNVSGFEPDALQQETRAYLQQLREERRRRPEATLPPDLESQRKTQKVASSQSNLKRKACTCRTRGGGTASSTAPYRCPYCTPVQNSSFGHAKDTSKKSSNSTRTVLSSTNIDKKKVLYKPSASTVLIEKHIVR